MDKYPGDPPGAAGGTAGGSPGRRPAGTLFWGRTFPVNLAKTQRLPSKQSDPGAQPRQSISVNGSQRQPPVPHNLVFGPRPGTTLLHTPGTKMT